MLIWSIIAAASPVLVGASGVPCTIKAAPAPDYEDLFRRTSGWIGADGNFSIPLGSDRVLWLFSDTFIGEIKDSRRANWSMINNSVAIQRLGPKPSVEFYYGTKDDGSPRSFVVSERGAGYFWLFHGALTAKGLYIFLMRVETVDPGTTFGFRGTGVTLGHVPNPDAPPPQWRITQRDLDFCIRSPEGSLIYGCSVLKDAGYVCVYGLDSMVRDGKKRSGAMVLARVPEDQLGDLDAWRFLSGGKWQPWPTVPDALCEGMATEYSVSYLSGLGRYVAVYTAGGILGRIMLRTAPRPEGPWDDPVEIYVCPDAKWHEKTFSYAAKAHPELAKSPNELVITYATNSMHFADLIDDARLYWPRFVRVTFER